MSTGLTYRDVVSAHAAFRRGTISATGRDLVLYKYERLACLKTVNVGDIARILESYDDAEGVLLTLLASEWCAARGAIDELGQTISQLHTDKLKDVLLTVIHLSKGNLHDGLTVLEHAAAFESSLELLAWKEALQVEAWLDLGRVNDAMNAAVALVSKLEERGILDELFIRARYLVARGALDHALTPGATRDATVNARAMVKLAATAATGCPRYEALVNILALLCQGAAQNRLIEHHHDVERLTRLGLVLDAARARERHAKYAYQVARRNTRVGIGQARDSFAKIGADARASALANIEGGADAGHSVAATRSILSRSILGMSEGDPDDVELQAVFAVNRALSSELRSENLMAAILHEVVSVMKAERGALLLRDEHGALHCTVAVGIQKESVVEGGTEISFSVIRNAEATGEVQLSDNAQVDARFRGKASVLATQVRSLLCAPLKAGGAVHGVLYLDSTIATRIFKESHRELLSVFANQAATALENARLFGEIKVWSQTLEQQVHVRTSELAQANESLAQTIKNLTEIELKLVAAEKDLLENEMKVARKVQKGIVPDSTLHSFPAGQLMGYLEPATFVGGDFWTFVPLTDDRTLVLIGDVTGHGVGAGMVTTTAKACFDTMARSGTRLDVSTVLSTLNDVIFDSAHGSVAMTAFAMLVDPSAQEIVFANAGHNPPLYVEHANGLPRLGVLVARGVRLGEALGATFDTKIRRFERGDRVLLYTDGLVECANANDDPFGERRLRRAVIESAKLPIIDQLNAIRRLSSEHFAATPRADDVSCLLLEFAL